MGVVEEAYKKLVADFLAAGGPPDDVIVKIGQQFFGCPVAKANQGPIQDMRVEGAMLLGFDYLEKFMQDCFLAAGPQKRLMSKILAIRSFCCILLSPLG